MSVTMDQLENWMAAPSENEHLEFKEAKNRFDFEKLVKYCVALANEGGITIAALVLLGAHKALGKHLAQAEVVYEYRSNEASISYQQRKEFREGFLLIHDTLWETINLRNDIFQYQDGLFRQEIPTFNEAVVREAILNAVSHRDYRLAGSVFIRQYPTRLEVVSPGGFPHGITVENILWRQSP